MNYMFLGMALIFFCAQGIAQKQFTMKNGSCTNSINVFNLTGTSVAFLCCAVICCFDFEFHTDTIWYAVIFSAGYSAAVVFGILAIKKGSLAISILIINYSLIVPSVYGMLFLQEPFKPLSVAGIAVIVISIFFLIFQPKKEEKGQPEIPQMNHVDLKEKRKQLIGWFICIFFAFIGNAVCSTVQKIHQTSYNGQYKPLFMMMATGISTLICLTFFLLQKKEEPAKVFKTGWPYAISFGILNIVVNMLMMVLATRLPSVVVYPTIAVGGLMLTLAVSILLYKERITILQTAGFFTGLAAIVLLNLT